MAKKKKQPHHHLWLLQTCTGEAPCITLANLHQNKLAELKQASSYLRLAKTGTKSILQQRVRQYLEQAQPQQEADNLTPHLEYGVLLEKQAKTEEKAKADKSTRAYRSSVLGLVRFLKEVHRSPNPYWL